jgi:membrane protein implicated in regulation of membrane protease activity
MGFFFVFLKSGKIAFWIILCVFSGYSIFWLLSFYLRTKREDRAEKRENFRTLSLLLPSGYLCMLGIIFPAAAVKSEFGAFFTLGFAFLMIFLGLVYAGLISNFIKKRKRPN